MDLSESEIDRGLVLHLDPDALEEAGGTYTCSPDRRVRGGHFFLCVGADDELGDWLPIYSRDGVGREPLSASGRYGHPKWTEAACYYHVEQVWTAPHDAVVYAADVGNDMSRSGSRNGMTDNNIPELPPAI